jgi:hypothetical protein
MVEANLVIQEARLAVSRSEPLDAKATFEAGQRCLGIREKLLSQTRPEESARLLMLAADANTIAGDSSTKTGRQLTRPRSTPPYRTGVPATRSRWGEKEPSG